MSKNNLLIWAALPFLVCTTALGQEKKLEILPAPKQKEELLPPPQVVPPLMPQSGNLLAPYAPPYVPKFGTRDVWYYYGVDSSGRFRPRVIYAPHGAYYSANGNPYPWTSSRSTLYMPYASD